MPLRRRKPLLIADSDLDILCKTATVIEQDGHGLKVLRSSDGTYIKFFRRKRILSSATLWPYAHRFVENSAKLIECGIAAPEVLHFYETLDKQRMVVQYTPVEGASLKDLSESGKVPEDLVKQVAQFICTLHDIGIYFRSIHLANIIVMANQRFGLIDVSDLRFLKRSLPRRLRVRNIAHITRLKNEPRETDRFQNLLAQRLRDLLETVPPDDLL